jgi:hypothetical protein
MRAGRFGIMVALGLTLAGCARRTATAPTRNVPAGTVVFQFTRKVKGSVELTLDGVRIPVVQKAKKARQLVVRGLAPGRHRFFLSGPKDAFGPDQGEFELTAERGVHMITFSTGFDAVLYGKSDPAPAAEGIPGVRADLEK